MQDTLDLLEWPELLFHLTERCYTPYGIKHWQDSPFLPDKQAVATHLAEVDALKGVVMRYGEPAVDFTIGDILPALLRVAKGGILTAADLRQLLASLKGAYAVSGHLVRHWEKEDQWAMLAHLMSDWPQPVETIARLEEVVGPKSDELLDSASPQLFGLRRRLSQQRQALNQKMQGYLSNPNYVQALQSPVITERDGRSVLPVKVEFKSTIPGVVHSGSTSGATLFVEPSGAIELNNAIQQTMGDIQAEVQRILKAVSQDLEAQSEGLIAYIRRLGEVDRRLAAARLAIALRANMPVDILDSPGAHLKQSRHPLLVLQQKNKGKNAQDIVANNITLGEGGVRTLIITGPNTGGKTVLLKTIGLTALMLQAGLHLPCEEGSKMALFTPVLVDIGDQQSLSENLSTFSGHLTRLKHFLAEETPLANALVLIDEIGSGTDPAEGAALAKAILETLYDRGAMTVVTTHLGELKLEAHHHPGYLNASMIFDPEALQPTYQLLLGVPGTSNALIIAERLGVNHGVIARARTYLSQPMRESSDLIQELEYKNRKTQEALQEAESLQLAAKDQYQKLETERQQFHEERRKILNQFKASLRGKLVPLEEQLKELQQLLHADDAEKLMALRQWPGKLSRLSGKADHILREATEEVEASEAEDALPMDEFEVGETVRSRRLSLTGVILKKKPTTGEVLLEAGNIKVTVPLADIEKIHQPKKKKPASPDLSRVIASLPIAHDAKLECDVRGQRVEEAMAEVERFIDQAVLAGFEKVGIIHGLGTGALKKAIRQYLAKLAVVKTFYPDAPQFGGDGKTVIELA